VFEVWRPNVGMYARRIREAIVGMGEIG